MKAKSAPNKFLNSLLLLTAICGVLTWIVAYYGFNRQVPNSTWLILGFITLITLIIHHYLISANKKRPQRFVAAFMGSLSVKLFLSLGIIILVRYTDPENFKFSAVCFSAYYLVYTFIEIKSLLPHIRSS